MNLQSSYLDTCAEIHRIVHRRSCYGAEQLRRWWLSLAILIATSPAFGWEDILVHQHYARIVGVLPEPYSSIELEVALNEETDVAGVFRIVVGGREISLSDEDMAKLKDLELGTLTFKHGIYRDQH